jgi:hypothetical protein
MEAPFDQDRLRAATLSNNVLWLRSFGSEVVEREGRVDIVRSPVPAYVGSTAFDGDALRQIVKEHAFANDSRVFADMFAVGSAERALLRDSGYEQIAGACSVVVAGTVRPTTRRTDGLRITPARNWRAWSDLYSAAFEQSEVTAEINRERWRKSFRSPEVEHWFYQSGSQPIAVCQTVHAFGVTGLYSFGILRPWRCVRTSALAIRALHAEISSQNDLNLYFEVLLRHKSSPARTASRLGLHVIRKVCGFERPVMSRA